MSFSWLGSATAAGTGVTSLACNVPAAAVPGDLLVAVFAVEGVAAGSGPWIIPNIGQLGGDGLGPFKDWLQVCWQAPSATGVGCEVWVAIYESGTDTVAHFTASQNVVAVMGAWSGEYNPTGQITDATVRLAPTAQVVGNQPPAPAVNPNTGELIVAVGADLMGASGFGSPSGFTNRVDAARSGHGTVEAALADAVAAAPGDTGPITFPNAAASGSSAGVTATLCVRPAPSNVGSGGVMDAPLPEDLDIGNGYTIRVTTVDPVTGDQVGGTSIGTVVITASAVDTGEGGGSGPGSWFLVPGSQA